MTEQAVPQCPIHLCPLWEWGDGSYVCPDCTEVVTARPRQVPAREPEPRLELHDEREPV